MAQVLPLVGRPSASPLRRQWQGRWPKGRTFSSSSSIPFLRSGSSLNTVYVAATSSSWSVEEEGKPQEGDEMPVFAEADGPVSVQLEILSGEEQFDNVSAEAEAKGVPFVVVWIAQWCRKCIYLKPKLEKLAAVYHPSIRFYSVDVNSVPHKFVKRAGITRMPTIQLWKGSTMQAEVIGGHKGWQVVNDVRLMIDNAL
ncbi:thioredoxin-like 3-2, chloroplastic [Wolffia australiana]